MAVKKEKTFDFPSPRDNPELVGHLGVLRNFDDAWKMRDQYPIHPVWILSGPRGIGKATMAHQIARRVYGNIGDFFILDIDAEHAIKRDSNGKDHSKSKKLSLELVSNMIEKMQLSSMSGGWRVIVVDSLDEMTMSATNAMLKLLEEPPEKTLFLLVSHNLGGVLPTIRSRARVEKIAPLTINQLRELCMTFLPNEDMSSDILKLSGGSFGKIANLKNSGGDVIFTELLNTLKNPNTNAGDLLRIAKKIAPYSGLHGILLDAVAYFGLADLYSSATRELRDIETIFVEPEITIFKILTEIKKCL
ncbi:MAG: AAA family ATPase [Rickettsiales bacterium]|nr:AAA family ATPase [Rickettsiales bacterium]